MVDHLEPPEGGFLRDIHGIEIAGRVFLLQGIAKPEEHRPDIRKIRGSGARRMDADIVEQGIIGGDEAFEENVSCWHMTAPPWPVDHHQNLSFCNSVHMCRFP